MLEYWYIERGLLYPGPSSETQGWLVGARENKSGKEMKRRMCK